MGDAKTIEQVMNQLSKLFCVYSVQELLPERSIRRELVMFKVRAETPDIRNEIIQIANIFRASIIDVSLKSLTLALIGDETKADAMQKLLEPSASWSWCAPAWSPSNGAPIPSATRPRNRPSLIWARTSCKAPVSRCAEHRPRQIPQRPLCFHINMKCLIFTERGRACMKLYETMFLSTRGRVFLY